MNDNDFTVLQSVYFKDNPEYLNLCFETLSLSSIKPQKIVLVKDGKLSEGLEEVIKSWAGKLPIYECGYLDNRGLAYALNYGLNFVSTEYVARMDSDDYCFPDRFEKQLMFLRENPNAEICGTGLSEFYIDKNGCEHRKARLYPAYIDRKSKSLFRGTPVGHPTVMLKTDLLKKYKYSEKTKMNEDIELWFRLLIDNHSIYNIQEPLLNFRITDGTFKRRSVKKAWNEYKIYSTNLIRLFGVNWRLCFPLARLLTRFLPYSINKKLYFSKVRNKLLNK